MEAQFGKLVWSIDPRASTRVVCGERGICSTGGYNDNRRDPDDVLSECEELANIIVRRVNAHNALVEALKWYVKHDYTTQEGHEFWLAGKAAAIEALALSGETP